MEEYRTAAVRQLSADVGIPAGLKESAKKEDLEFLAQSAYIKTPFHFTVSQLVCAYHNTYLFVIKQ